MTACCAYAYFGQGKPCELCASAAEELDALRAANAPPRIGQTHPLGNRKTRRSAEAKRRAEHRDARGAR